MKSVLIATIGTRDLMFQIASGEWFNVGDDQMQLEIIGEQAEVISDLQQFEIKRGTKMVNFKDGKKRK
jgi:hypothetical protein